MTAGFERIAIIGVGLIGGSVAAALKRLDPSIEVLGIDTNEEALVQAQRIGLLDDHAHALKDPDTVRTWLSGRFVDLVVLAAPVESSIDWIDRLATCGYDGVVTDVSSTKEEIVRAAYAKLPHPEYFVPGHPMAGSEISGLAGARGELFDGAYWILAPGEKTDMHVYRRLHTLITALGARVISVEPSEHDKAVAVVSHVPHVAASSLVSLAGDHAGDKGELLRLAAGGFKDTTRIASGNPDLWAGICLSNANALAESLHEFGEVITQFEHLIRERDETGLRDLLARAADVRDSLPAQWVPHSTALIKARIPIGDHPGMIAQITGAAGRTGCNIESIEIDHQTEDSAILELILTDEGDQEQFNALLIESGFEPRFESLDARS